MSKSRSAESPPMQAPRTPTPSSATSKAPSGNAHPSAAIARLRARYATLNDDAERPTGSLTHEQLAVLSALPTSTPEERDDWWGALRERLDSV